MVFRGEAVEMWASCEILRGQDAIKRFQGDFKEDKMGSHGVREFVYESGYLYRGRNGPQRSFMRG